MTKGKSRLWKDANKGFLDSQICAFSELRGEISKRKMYNQKNIYKKRLLILHQPKIRVKYAF